ncbi:MAG: HAD family hydrolase [Planctomycetota bacterium]|jgi:phosphoglycolate phosphatase
MDKTKFNAILFDLDGTLLDTLADLANSMNTALEKLGFPCHPIDAYRYFVGDGVEQLVKRVLPKDRLDQETLNTCLAEYRLQYSQRWSECTKPYPRIPELLTEIEKRSIPKAILSNKPHEFTLLTVEKLLPNWTFDIVQGVSDTVIQKPDPAGALNIAEKLNIHPHSFIYLGDTNTDMQTAVAAGMYPIGVLWGFRDADELLKNGAKKLITTPLEILPFLEAQ